MKVEIETDPLGPLRVLSGLPDQPLARIEGLNGIGKTLAVKLLELCTGGSPYRYDTPAWSSFCRGLGKFRVTVTGLADGDFLTWSADTRKWGAGPTFQEVSVNGHQSTTVEARKLFRVVRLAGDEGLLETLAGQIDEWHNAVVRFADQRLPVSDGPYGQALDLLEDTKSDLRRYTRGALEAYEEQLNAVREDARRSREALKDRSRKRDRVIEAIRLADAVERIAEDRPELLRTRARLDERLEELKRTRHELGQKLEEIAAGSANSEAILDEIGKAEKVVAQRLAQHEEASERMAELLDALALDEPSGADDMRAQVEQLVASIDEQIRELDHRPALYDLTRNLSETLGGSQYGALSEDVLITVGSTDVTVRHASDGLKRRGHELARAMEAKAPPQVEDLREAKERLAEQSRLLDEIDETRRMLDFASRNAEKNRRRLEKALALLEGQPKTAAEDVRARIASIDDEVLALAGERAEVVHRLAGMAEHDPATLRAALAERLAELAVPADDLDELRRQADTAVEQADATRRERERLLEEARDNLDQFGQGALRQLDSLLTSSEHEWLRELVEMPVTRSEEEEPLTPADAVGVLERAGEVVESVSSRLNDFRTHLLGLTVTLAATSRTLRGGPQDTSPLSVPVRAWFSDVFSAAFDKREVREQLLPDADAGIRVDLDEVAINWTQDGKPRSRPLAAFSSGQQAFAYTRARLAQLAEESEEPRNRLIVLDEFGAFIAHDLLSALTEHLRDRLQHPPRPEVNEQVLIILPLSQDYAEAADRTTGKLSERFRNLSEQVERRGFAVREFDL